MNKFLQFLKNYWVAIVLTIILIPTIILLDVGYGAKFSICVEIALVWVLVRTVVNFRPLDQQVQRVKKNDKNLN